MKINFLETKTFSTLQEMHLVVRQKKQGKIDGERERETETRQRERKEEV